MTFKESLKFIKKINKNRNIEYRTLNIDRSQ